jgi:hypothetical protein
LADTQDLQDVLHGTVQLADAIAARLLEVPAIVLVGAALVGFFGVAGVLRLIGGRASSLTRGRGFTGVAAVFIVLLLVLLFEQRTQQMVTRTGDLRQKVVLLGAGTGSPDARPFGDSERIGSAVRAVFPSAEYRLQAEAEGVDYIAITTQSPRLAVVHVAIVDLTAPGLRIEITDRKGEKSLTSDFARERDCVVAINGEAGKSPIFNAALGPWTGNWVVRGEAVQMEDTNLRPFLAFDRNNRAWYSQANRVDRELTPEKYNTLWGRWDLLRHGRFPHDSDSEVFDNPRPRCAMTIDRDGSKLFLLIADGRQPGYSEGIRVNEAAKLLAGLGAHEGMTCDEGGSAAMYLRSRDGIASAPSDRSNFWAPPDAPRISGANVERGTYTHFGVSFRPDASDD